MEELRKVTIPSKAIVFGVAMIVSTDGHDAILTVHDGADSAQHCVWG
jgi:hypothetical protein